MIDEEPVVSYPDKVIPIELDGDDPFSWDVIAAIAVYCRKACGLEIDCEAVRIVLVDQRPVWRVPEVPSQVWPQ